MEKSGLQHSDFEFLMCSFFFNGHISPQTRGKETIVCVSVCVYLPTIPPMCKSHLLARMQLHTIRKSLKGGVAPVSIVSLHPLI